MYFRNKILNADSNRVTDAELVRAARRGDKRAFVEIVARHQAMVCGIAFAILGDFATSEDAAQEAFLTAWRKFHDLREPEKLRSWLGRIARNAALGHLRRQRGHEALDEALTLPDESPGPDQLAASEEEAALVRDSLSKLPETYRLPLVLFYREGQSVRAVAEALAISEDAVKQRLARGREMLHDQMSGVIESVLTRTAPTAVFTMTIAAAIGALAAPTAIAATAFTATSAAASTTSSLSSQVITAMSATKTSIITAVFVAAVCIPVGYHAATNNRQSHDYASLPQTENTDATAEEKARPSFESSAIFAEWRKLHEIHGTNAEAMPVLYDAIAAVKDTYRRRAFRSALIAEWVQLDPTNGLAFFLEPGRDTTQRREFFAEWLARDAVAALDTLMASGPGWEAVANETLLEIARRVPSRVAALVPSLPKAQNDFWDTKVRDAFAIVAEGGLASARASAEALTGPNRQQALAGIALVWGKTDMNAAMAWAHTLPEAISHEGDYLSEIIRAALIGKAAVDPASALDQIGIVSPGGKQNYFATTTGARVLKQAAEANYDATVAWIAAHPGRLGYEDMMGIAHVVSDRLSADPAGFLNHHAGDNTLAALIPAIGSAIINESGGQRATIWEWLKTQPENEATKLLKEQVMRAAAWQDPKLALNWAAEFPRTPEGDAQTKAVALNLLNGGIEFDRLEGLLEKVPERIRQPLIEYAFTALTENRLNDPQAWIARFALLPESARGQAAQGLARAWAAQIPEEAIGWVSSLAEGEIRNGAMAAALSSWSAKDVDGAAKWAGTLPPGPERDRSAGTLAIALVEKNPQAALDWMLSMGDSAERERIANQAVQTLAVRNPAAASHWIEAAPFTPEVKARLRTSIEKERAPAPH